ncbi:hypothetical protein ATO4_05349 [Aurantimonas sp. 22II-16-19i]|nr:hypothetical protein ATO4_05349 [Aurantimonas sp. 22II-16-19i]
MGGFRRFLRDRVSAAAFAVVLAQLMLLQALVGAQGCLAAMSGGDPQILCSGEPLSAKEAASGADRTGAGSHCADCPCATACGGSAPLAVPFADAGEAFAAPAAEPGRPIHADAAIARLPPSGRVRLRGPPAFAA